MIVLTYATSDKLRIKLTTTPATESDVIVSWRVVDGTSVYDAGNTCVKTTGTTTVDVLGTPPSGQKYLIDKITISNRHNASVRFNLFVEKSAVEYLEKSHTVSADSQFEYNEGKGWTEEVAGGSAAWGSITGTLSDQTDLQTELDEANGYTVQTITAASHNETAVIGVHVLLCDTTSTSITVNLPTAVGNKATFVIKKINAANTLTVDPSGAQTIDGGATAAWTALDESITIYSDNANWRIN